MARDGTKSGGGSRKGIPNRATADARKAISAFVNNNSGLLQELLDEIRQVEGPLAAFNCIKDLIEYHVPKLSRTESTVNVNGQDAFIGKLYSDIESERQGIDRTNETIQ